MSQDAKIITGISVVTVVILIIGAIFLSSGTSASSSTTGKKADASKLATTNMFQTGPKNAPITLVEFGDYQCPACGAMYPVVKALKSSYGKKLNMVFKNYPLVSVHKNAMLAAQAAVAASKQNKFWQMHDILYDNQTTWGESNDAKGFMDEYAKKIGLDTKKFDADMNASDVHDRINADITDGNSLAVNATPTFYINNIQYTGQYDLQTLKAALDAAAKK